MKKENILKVITITLAIVLVTMVGFFGVYQLKQNRMVDQVKDYSYAMDIKGTRTITLTPSTEESDIVLDENGRKVVGASDLTEDEIAEKGYTTQSVVDNTGEQLTAENYQKTKKIIEDRLNESKVDNYIVSVDETTGKIIVEIPEDTQTDSIVSNINIVGDFEIVANDTNEVLMSKDDIKEVKVMYGSDSSTSTTSSGTSVYLDIEFNKEGATKLEEISGIYNSNTTSENTATEETTEEATDESTEEATDETTDETTDTSTEEKKVTLQIDGETLISTSFSEVMKTGHIQLSIGSASTDADTINEYAQRAGRIAVILNNETMPVKYTIDGNTYMLSEITNNDLQKVEIGVAIVSALALIILMIRYKKNGIFASISFVGMAALLLLVIRYANVYLSLDGIVAIVLVLILNYVLTNNILKRIKKEKIKSDKIVKISNEALKDFFIKIIPICIMSVAFCFITWAPISSFGMVMFWGITLMVIYNYLLTSNLLKLVASDIDVKQDDKKVVKKDSKKEVKKDATKKVTKKTNKAKKDNK